MAKKRLQKKRSSSTVRKQESEILQVTTSKTEPVRVETSKAVSYTHLDVYKRQGMVRPTLAATPGDLSLVLPKRILDGIIEMIYALDKIAPGTANDDTLLYGVEVKFYNMEVDIDENLESNSFSKAESMVSCMASATSSSFPR